jgi:CHAD domain-containing protein
MHDELAEIDMDKLSSRLEALVSIRGDGRHRVASFGLQQRVAENTGRLEAAVADAGALFALDRLHEVRIAAKKLRYALELVDELLRVGTRRAIARLREMQDLLGRMHDLGILADYVRRTGAPAPGAVDVKDLIAVIEGEIHSLHAAYLARIHVVAGVIADCHGGLAGRIGARLGPSRAVARAPLPVE